jgi:hypothetical protein
VRRLSTDLPFYCATCDVEIKGSPTFHVGLPFCCAGCVAGGPCICSYDVEEALDVRHCHDVADPATPVAASHVRGALESSRELVSTPATQVRIKPVRARRSERP